MKRLLIATALTMCAAGAYASNFRGADQVYIPTAGRLVQTTGAGNSFISDVQLANLTSDTVVISVIYQPINTPTNPNDPDNIGTEFPDAITLLPFERKEYKDFFQSALDLQSGFGLLILNGCKQGADCGPDGQDDEGNSENFRAISAESRIYTYKTVDGPALKGTKGQLFSGIPWYNFVSMLQSAVGLDEVFITGITHTTGSGSFRTNIGLVNASQFSTTNISVTLYKGRIHADDKVAEIVRTLTPLENIQSNIPGLFPSAPLSDNYFVVVKQISSTPNPSGVPSSCDLGCPAFLAYGSALDNVSDDPTTLESQYLKELTTEAILVIYPTAAGKQPWRRAVRK